MMPITQEKVRHAQDDEEGILGERYASDRGKKRNETWGLEIMYGSPLDHAGIFLIYILVVSSGC